MKQLSLSNLMEDKSFIKSVSFSEFPITLICAVYGDRAIAESTVHKSFGRFKSGNFDQKDQERFSRPTVIVKHLKTLCYVNRNDVLASLRFNENKIYDPKSIRISLFKRNINDSLKKKKKQLLVTKNELFTTP